ncbi:hypothetical protein JNUCC64_12345 [Streptomyces sp. JNUCC 64]
MGLVELIAGADERGLAVSGLACLDRCVPLLGGDDELLRPLWAVLGVGGDAGEWGERVDRVREALTEGAAGGDGGVCATEDEAGRLALGMLAAAPAALPDKLQGGTPSDGALRDWADDCSAAALRIHLLLDPAARPGTGVTGSDGSDGSGRSEGSGGSEGSETSGSGDSGGADGTGAGDGGGTPESGDADSGDPGGDDSVNGSGGADGPDGADGAESGPDGELPPLAAAELRRQAAVLEVLAARGTGGLRQAHAVTTEGRRVLRAVVSRRARGRN